jgi:hypothetical protein
LLAVELTVTTLLWRNEQLTTLIPLAASRLSPLYFLQKQKLEELQRFRGSVQGVQREIDALNEKLALVVKGESSDLSKEQSGTLVVYFNRCGEEYLYYTKGSISDC